MDVLRTIRDAVYRTNGVQYKIGKRTRDRTLCQLIAPAIYFIRPVGHLALSWLGFRARLGVFERENCPLVFGRTARRRSTRLPASGGPDHAHVHRDVERIKSRNCETERRVLSCGCEGVVSELRVVANTTQIARLDSLSRRMFALLI